MKYLYRFLIVFLISTTPNYGTFVEEIYASTPLSSGQTLIESVKINEPLTFCNEPVPLNETDIKERLERELLISLDNSNEVILWIKRANRYLPHIEKVLKNNSLPDDLKYIAIVESSLRPLTRSNKGAVGYWQFIESTGMKYGMVINNDIDERRNFFTSTEAAVNYLKDLYALFGSWTLAAAAYNMGEEGLKTEMMVQKVSNYYQLDLYQETQRYIFRLLAAKIIISNPEKYGYSLTPDDLYKPIQFDRVEISANQPVPLYIIAQAAKTYFKVIKDLNPHIKNYYLPAGKYELMVPQGAAMGFSERYENLLSQWLAERNEYVYIVQKGDNLSTIAERFNVPVKAIMIWNDITNGKKVLPGNKLFIFSDKLKKETNANKIENAPTEDPAIKFY
ncbi:MAG: transglycosylase SLT domain-containing protein [Ignavibacteriaceae bacterium]